MGRIGTRRWRDTAFHLTERQEQVLRLIERGCSNGEIAEELGISLDGAKFHVSEILAKLEVSRREDAVEAWKRQRGRGAPVSAFVVGLKWTGLAAAAGVIGIAALFVWSARGDNDEDRGPAAPEPSPPAVAALPAAFQCPAARTPTPTFPPGASRTPEAPSDGPGAIRFNDRWYSYRSGVTGAWQQVPAGLLGPKYGEICYASVFGNRPAPGDVARDGDSWGLQVGMEVFSVAGYRPDFRLALAVPGQPFLMVEPIEVDQARTGADYLDLRGKVVQLDIFGESMDGGAPRRLATLSDKDRLDILIEQVLAAPVVSNVQYPDGGRYLYLEFLMEDGTYVSRTLNPTGVLAPVIDVPPAFEAEIARLVAAGP